MPTLENLPQLLTAAAANGRAKQEGKNSEQLEKLKDYLAGQRQGKNLEAVQNFIDQNAAKGRKVNMAISPDGGVSAGQQEQNPWLQQMKTKTNETQSVLKQMKTELGQSEDGLKAAQTAQAFLQNPNNYNLSDVKAMAVLMQGLPARAFGSEAKASGFDPRGWSAAVQKINDYADNPKANPLTQDTLDTFRNNFQVMKDGLVKGYQAKSQNFWQNEAPSLAPMLSSTGELDQLHQGHHQMVQSAFGDVLAPSPWQKGPGQPNQAGQAPAPTVQPKAPGVLDKLGSFFHGLSSPSQAPAQAPAQTPPMGGGADEAADFANFYKNIYPKLQNGGQ